MQNKNPVKQGHEINILFYRVLFTGSILLRISGLREKDLIHISLTESIIGLCAVLVISTIISIIMLLLTGISSLVAPLISTFVFIIALLLERVITQSRFIKKIDIVTELRNEVV